jgi:hypothetical protein
MISTTHYVRVYVRQTDLVLGLRVIRLDLDTRLKRAHRMRGVLGSRIPRSSNDTRAKHSRKGDLGKERGGKAHREGRSGSCG